MLTPIKNERYISVKADGVFHEKVSEGTEGAVYREYELKDGTKGGKWERLYKSVDNVHIKGIRFEDGEYGENILVTLSDGENEVVWAEGTGTNFGSDLMKKLPNVNFAEKMSIAPYSFTTEGGKNRRGVNIFQNDKLGDYFTSFVEDEAPKKLHGFPEWPKKLEDMGKNDWKKYFLEVEIFLTDYTKKNIIPKLETSGVEYEPGQALDTITYPADDIDPEAIPF